MSIDQKRKILEKIKKIQDRITELEDVRFKLASSEFVSASTSSGTGSKSYSRQNLTQINDAILQLKRELKSYKRLITGDTGFKHIYTIYYS